MLGFAAQKHIKEAGKPGEYWYERTLIAVSNEPAKMWSTGSWELLHHIWVGLIPLVGGTKNPSSAPPPAPIGTSCSNHSHENSILHNIF